MATSADLRELAAALDDLDAVPTDTAARVASPLQRLLLADFRGGRTAYGASRPRGVNGPVTLHDTGAADASLRVVAQGAGVRAEMTVGYARFLARFQPLPTGPLPAAWARVIDREAVEAIERRLP